MNMKISYMVLYKVEGKLSTSKHIDLIQNYFRENVMSK